MMSIEMAETAERATFQRVIDLFNANQGTL